MSIDICRQVDRDQPDLLQRNINATCSQFADLVCIKLKLAGHAAYRMCKVAGEGQYTPPGFAPRTVTGLDGKPYVCTGISHDAIWCDGQQFDLIGQGNDSPDPIFHPDGSPMRGIPTWNAIPQQFWRPQNPPLKDNAPTPQPPMPTQPPGREEALDEMRWLDAYYAAPEGLQRPNGLSLNGKPDFEGIAAWYLDIYQRERMAMKSRADARAAYVTLIRHSDEWKSKHPGETP